MYQSSVRSTTANPAKTALALVAIFSLLLALFAIARPALAQEGVGEADCPPETEFLRNLNQSDLVVGLELAPGVTITAVTRENGATGEATSVTISNTTSENITIAVKGGSDQAGNFVTIGPEDSATISVLNNPTISNLSVCEGPELVEELPPTLTVVKEVINDDGGTLAVGDFDLFVDGNAVVSGATTVVEAGAHVVSETAVQGYTGSIGGDCDAEGNVTVAAGDTATCTITNNDVALAAEDGQIAIFKTMCESIGDQNVCNGRDTSLDGYSIDFEIYAGTGTDGELVETATVTLSENAEGQGNTGNGSQGRILSGELAEGTYTVCEVPVAYLEGEQDVPLEVVPRPEAGNGGSTGGNQTLFDDNCIVVEVKASGTAEVKFLDMVAEGEQDEFGRIEIVKAANDADESFAFSATWEEDNEFTLMDGESLTFGDFLAGDTFTVTEVLTPEQVAAGWSLLDIDCGEADVDVDGSSVTITVAANTTITCTFTNELDEGENEVETVEVSIMKHLCGDVATVAEFEAIEAAAAAANPENPVAPLVATVLACPTIVVTGDIPTDGAVTGGAVDFEFSVRDASGTQLLSEDGMFMQGALCETDVNLDADGDGQITNDVCLDVSHYSFEVVDGVVIITETDAPAGHRFGTIRFTPGSDDADALVGTITSVEASGVIVLDTRADEDDSVMVHAYNFVTEDTQGGGGGGNETPREGTQGGNPLPNTAISPNPNGSVPAALLALLMLSGLGAAASAVKAEVRRRR